MENNTSLKALLGKLSSGGCALVQGEVISSSPLKIKVYNDDKLVLGERVLVVPGRIGVLSVGEAVHIIVFGRGKQYYVLDRV
ncbi:MAG: hypothetical protein ACI4I9_04610 [Porcipelethomonas sp.]